MAKLLATPKLGWNSLEEGSELSNRWQGQKASNVLASHRKSASNLNFVHGIWLALVGIWLWLRVSVAVTHGRLSVGFGLWFGAGGKPVFRPVVVRGPFDYIVEISGRQRALGSN